MTGGAVALAVMGAASAVDAVGMQHTSGIRLRRCGAFMRPLRSQRTGVTFMPLLEVCGGNGAALIGLRSAARALGGGKRAS